MKEKNKKKTIRYNNKEIKSNNNTITNTPLKTTPKNSIIKKSNNKQINNNILNEISSQKPPQRTLRSSKSMKEIKTIERSLLMSIEKSEKIDNEKIKLAETINFRETPDKIVDTDEFGFIKDSNDNNFKKDDKEALLQYNARLEKWNFMLSNYDDFYKKHFGKLKERVRKGIPDSIRGYAWQKIINLDDFYKKDIYQKLNEENTNEELEQVIIKDIDRTFPKCTFFKEGMGFIAALLLTYMEEERAFFMLHALMKNRSLESLYLPGFPDLNKKLYVLLNLEKKLIPKVYNVFKKNDIIPFSYASEWFLCLFSRSLKFNSLVRIFDCFILEGYKIIYRFALAFLKSKEKEITECKGMDMIFKVLRGCFENVDIEEIFKMAFGFHLSKKDIENFEKEYDKNKNDKKNEFISQM